MDFFNEELKDALSGFITKITSILGDKVIMACLHGSVMYDDLSPGYSDLDFHCLCLSLFSEEEKNQLLEYRKELKRSSNIYSRMLEGEFAPIVALNRPINNSVVYWGTSRERLYDAITLKTFSLIGLKKNGIVIYGNDLRNEYPHPSREEMLADIDNLINSIRTYAVVTNEGIHSADWLFLICQSMFWLENDNVTSKTKAAEWVINTYINEWIQYLKKAIELRKCPDIAKTEVNRKWLSDLGPIIQLACDDLGKRAKLAR